jgi:hypothetical protein
MIVWTIGYRPFVMGGDVYYPLGTEIKVGKKYSLGKRYNGYLITAPNGKTFVAEATTGAFVGPSIESVKKDIKEGEKKVMDEQMEYARSQVPKIEKVEPEEFWKKLKCLRGMEGIK